MNALLKYLCRYRRSTRIVTSIGFFILTVALTMAALAYGSVAKNDIWVLWAALIPVGFAVLVTPVVVSLINEDYEAQGVFGMFSSKPVNEQPPGLLDPGFNRWFIGH